jgi:hypothetical protein
MPAQLDYKELQAHRVLQVPKATQVKLAPVVLVLLGILVV